MSTGSGAVQQYLEGLHPPRRAALTELRALEQLSLDTVETILRETAQKGGGNRR
jgi:hypothetical protein